MCQHDHELVSGETGDGVGVAHGVLEPLRNLA
jgi:hypothetical protein